MYRCCNCNATFEEPETKNIMAEEYLGINNMTDTRTRMDVSICPYCNDDDLEELEKCAICEEWNSPDDLYDSEGMVDGGVGYVCEQCLEDCSIF